tara:strand:+ start:475 stop:2091 length:1617 start_codon:yes stop_codon:yes gene_type:complete
MILTDTFIVENAELLIEQRGGKTIRRLRGTFGRCDEKNNNGRVYSKTLLEREVKRIAEAMSERRLLGELDHPTHDAVKLSNVSHLITNLDFKGSELIGECEILDTPAGKVAQALVEGGVKVGISSRGMGTLSEQADGSKHVNEDFKLVTFDLVADPSTRGAFPGLEESTQSALVEEIVKDTLDTAAKEKVFSTMLKDKLREKTSKWGNQHGKPTEVKKDKKKPTAEDPFKNWEDFYGAYTGGPRIARKTRGYEDAETVTEPQEVVEGRNQYAFLREFLVENVENYEDLNTYERMALRLVELNNPELNELFGFGGGGSPSIRGRRAHLTKRRKERGDAISRKGEVMMRKAGMDLNKTKDMPAGTGGLGGAIKALRHNRAAGKALKIQSRGEKLRDKGASMQPRVVDKAAVRARIDTKLAGIQKKKLRSQQAKVDIKPQEPQQHYPKPAAATENPSPAAATENPAAAKSKEVFSGSTGVQPTLSSKTSASPTTHTSGGREGLLKGQIKKTKLRRGEAPDEEQPEKPKTAKFPRGVQGLRR